MAEFLNNSLELGTEYYIGTVMGIDIVNRKCNVYIPKLMMGLPGNLVINNEYPVKTENIINIKNLNIATSLTKTNIIEVQSYDIDEPMPEIGSLVLVYFLEGNPKYGYWEKFNPYGKYKVIESERYPKIFTLEIGEKKIQVNQDDYIKIDIPKEYEVIFVESEKTKLIKIHNDDNSVSISELQSIVNNLNNNLNSIKQEKIDDLEKLISEEKTTIETMKSSISETLYNSVQNYLNYKADQSNDLTLSLDDLKHNSKDVTKKTSALLDLTNQCLEYINYYQSNLLGFIPEGKVQEYNLLTNETAQKYFEDTYSKIIEIDSETNVEQEIQVLKEKISYIKTINYYYEDKENKVKTFNENLNNTFPKLLTDELKTIYNNNNPNDETTDENYQELVIAAISLHTSDNISSTTKINETNIYKSQDVYLNLMNLDFIVDAIEVGDNEYSLVIIDESVISQNNKESDIKIDPTKITIDVKFNETQYYAKYLTENSENVWIITSEHIDDNSTSISDTIYKFNSSDLDNKEVILTINYTDIFENNIEFKKGFSLDIIEDD